MTNNSRYLDSEGLRYFWSKILNSFGTVYNAGTGLSLDPSTHTFSLSASGVSAGNYGPSAAVTGNDGTTLSVPYITVDTYGRITSISNKTYTSKNTTYSSGLGISIGNNNSINLNFNPNGTSYTRTTLDLYPQIVSPDDFIRVKVPIATSSELGVVKVGDNLLVNNNGELSIDTDTLASSLYGEGDGIEIDQDFYIGVKAADNGGITVTSSGVALNAASGTPSGNVISVQLDSNGVPKVGIPTASSNGVNGASASYTGLMTPTYVSRLYDTYTKSEIDSAMALIKQFEAVVSPNLPTASASTMQKIYLVPSYINDYSASTVNFVESQTESGAYFYPTIKFTVPSLGVIVINSPLTDAYDFKPIKALTTSEDLDPSGTWSDSWNTIHTGSQDNYWEYKNKTGNPITVYIATYSNSLPTSVSFSVYVATADGYNIKNEWITVDTGSGSSHNYQWELIGTTEVNVERITNSEIDAICSS